VWSLVEAFDVLGDPVRRRIVELLAHGELAAGDVVSAVGSEFGISQPAVSQHLRVLRESGFARVRPDGARRLYSVDPAPLDAAERWIVGVRRMWEQRLDALGTELARGARERRRSAAAPIGRTGRTDRTDRTDRTGRAGTTPTDRTNRTRRSP
jgi:DNA-binding transcriptional ArsR family regulator